MKLVNEIFGMGRRGTGLQNLSGTALARLVVRV